MKPGLVRLVCAGAVRHLSLTRGAGWLVDIRRHVVGFARYRSSFFFLSRFPLHHPFIPLSLNTSRVCETRSSNRVEDVPSCDCWLTFSSVCFVCELTTYLLVFFLLFFRPVGFVWLTRAGFDARTSTDDSGDDSDATALLRLQRNGWGRIPPSDVQWRRRTAQPD